MQKTYWREVSCCPIQFKKTDLHMNTSDLQLGAVIFQKGRPIAYYSQQLNSAQRRYMTIEKGLLSIVETLKELRVFC